MSDTANPVKAEYDGLTITGIPRPDGPPVMPGLAFARIPGTQLWAQITLGYLDPAQASVNIASRSALKDALTGVTSAIAGSGTQDTNLIDAIQAGTAAQEASNQATALLGSGVVALKSSIDTGNQMTTTSNTKLEALHADISGTIHTDLANILTRLNGSLAVTGAFYPATQPVSATALPLPAGAATEATLKDLGTKFDALITATQANGEKVEASWYNAFAANGTATLATSAQLAGNARVTGIQMSAPTTLIGNLLGGTVASVNLFRATTTNGAYSATATATSVPLATVTVTQGESYWMPLRVDVPSGWFLRAQCSAGGVNVAVTTKAL